MESGTKNFSDRENKFFLLVIIVAFTAGSLGGIFGYKLAGGKLDSFGSTGPAVTKVYKVEEESATIDAAKKTTPSVVSITSESVAVGFFGIPQTVTGAGTGFIVDASGLIVTNKHVVEDRDAKYTVVTYDGKSYQAKVEAQDPLNDIAFLKIKADNLQVATLGDSGSLQVGQTVIAIGNALGQYEHSVTKGVVSGISRSIEASGDSGTLDQLNDVIQTDAAINPGNSGGPLVNIDGQVIGINTAVAGSAQNIGFAIPINSIKKQISSVKTTGKIVRPMLGIRFVPVTKELAARNDLPVDYGILIYSGNQGDSVMLNSPARKAGIQEGDIILEINGEKINEDSTLTGILQKFDPGQEITVKYLRDGKEKETKLTLGKSESD